MVLKGHFSRGRIFYAIGALVLVAVASFYMFAISRTFLPLHWSYESATDSVEQATVTLTTTATATQLVTVRSIQTTTVTRVQQHTAIETIFVQATAAEEQVKSLETASAQPASRHPKDCENPYLRPGYLWYSSRREERDTTWVPFYPGMLDQNYSQIYDQNGNLVDQKYKGNLFYKKTPPPYQLRKITPHPWMQELVEYHLLWVAARNHTEYDVARYSKLQKSLSWLQNLRVLVISDSVDRYQLTWICNQVYQDYELQEGRQRTSICTIPEFNISFTHWHVGSMALEKPKWWKSGQALTHIPFEERYEHTFKNHTEQVIGMNGHSPDLIIFQTGLWDVDYFTNAPQWDNTVPPDFERSLHWTELRLYMQRFRTVVQFIKDLFGDDVPMLGRTMTFKREVYQNRATHDIDRASRFVCAELGLEMMDFGALNDGHFKLYADRLHVMRGPTSVLWENMFFWYLFRARGGIEYRGQILKPAETGVINASEKWARCHDRFLEQQLYYI